MEGLNTAAWRPGPARFARPVGGTVSRTMWPVLADGLSTGLADDVEARERYE